MSIAKHIEKAEKLVEKSNKVLVFTGAGISTSSGIPDFRGTNGIWTKRDPVYYGDFMSSEKSKREYWEYKLETAGAFKEAVPNAAHIALAEFEKSGKLLALVTQNIDGLHRKAGSENLIELHGTNLMAACLGCGKKVLMEEALDSFRKTRQPPGCGDCGGYLKPAVVMFGETLNMNDLSEAFRLAGEADLAISVGSTLTVTPAAEIPLQAKAAGASYLVINIGPTAHDNVADIKIEANAAEVLPAILDF